MCAFNAAINFGKEMIDLVHPTRSTRLVEIEFENFATSLSSKASQHKSSPTCATSRLC